MQIKIILIEINNNNNNNNNLINSQLKINNYKINYLLLKNQLKNFKFFLLVFLLIKKN